MSEEHLAESIDRLVAKIDRIEIAKIEPGDVVFMFFPSDTDFDVASEYAETLGMVSEVPVSVVPLVGDVRIEIKRPEPEPNIPYHPAMD